MNARRLALAATILLGTPCADAQNATPKSLTRPALEVLRKFKEPDADKAATSDAAPSDAVHEATPDPVADHPAAPTEPAGGQAPPPATDSAHAATPADPAPAPPAAPPAPRQSLVVRVEKLHTGSGEMDPSQVKLLFPFPAKPLAQPPAGWCLKSSSSAPPFTREVELSPGNKITLTIRPDILVPDADGASVFSVPEPGFNPALGYRQNATVGTILARSIHQLDQDSIELGAAIDQLQQILVSLPKPEPKAVPAPDSPPDPKPDPKTKPSPARKK